MFMSGMYVTTAYMDEMLKVGKEATMLQWNILKQWADTRKPLVTKVGTGVDQLIASGYFVEDKSVATLTGYIAIMPDEYGSDSVTDRSPVDVALLKSYIPGLVGLFTKETGNSELLGASGKRDWGRYNIYWVKPIIQMIEAAPAEDLRDKANLVAEAMPIAIAKQRAKAYEIKTPLSIVKFVLSELASGSRPNVVEVR